MVSETLFQSHRSNCSINIVVVPYEITFYTGDVKDAGTDAQIFLKVFGAGGSSSDIMLEKRSEKFERGRIDLIKVIDLP